MLNDDSRPRAIGVSGPATAGKSTLAADLVNAATFVPIKFADPLKAMLAAFYRCLHVDERVIWQKLEGRLKFVACPYLMGRTPRHAMQTLGTLWGREAMHSEIWVEAWKRRASMPVNPVVADDVRFENEARAVRAVGGVVVEISRPGVDYARDHASEQGVRADHVVENPPGEPGAMIASLRALDLVGVPAAPGCGFMREAGE